MSNTLSLHTEHLFLVIVINIAWAHRVLDRGDELFKKFGFYVKLFNFFPILLSQSFSVISYKHTCAVLSH